MTYSQQETICIAASNAGIQATKFFALWNLFDGTKDFCENLAKSDDARRLLGGAHAKIVKEMSPQQMQKTLSHLADLGVHVVTTFSPDFPEKLRQISDPPYILFCRGNSALLNSRCFAVVGTRKVTSYGKRVTCDFTRTLAQHFTIVSGLAYGVDGIAHQTTLEENGSTIAVLGGGLINVYPASHRDLAERIVLNGGLLISEYGAEAVPQPYRFPHRNRIVSALSLGVLVCQAPLKSGTASTVECALEQGRDVFAVPGEIFDQTFSGNNALIKSVQGVCVTSPRDIEEYYHLHEVASQKGEMYQFSLEEQKVVNCLAYSALTFDQLVQQTQISPADLNFLLANLEIKSIIARLPGNSYRLYGGNE